MMTLDRIGAAHAAPSFYPLLLGLMLLFAGTPAAAYQWSFGAALASASFPSYRGSTERTTVTIPIPTFSIWNERWRVGRRGAQWSFSDRERWRLRLSANGSIPVNSNRIKIRADMPDLDPSFELGPALSYHIPLSSRTELRPEVLARAAFATDLKRIEHIGWIIQPRLTTLWKQRQRSYETEARLSLGGVINTRKYHEYFYTVADAFARPDRPAYRASGGFSGWRATSSLVWRWHRYGVYAYLSYDNLRDSVIEDSPLIETKDYVVGGLMLTFQIGGSEF